MLYRVVAISALLILIFILTTTTTNMLYLVLDKWQGQNTYETVSSFFFLLYWTFLIFLDIYFANMIIFCAKVLFSDNMRIIKQVKIIVIFFSGLMVVIHSLKFLKEVILILSYMEINHKFKHSALYCNYYLGAELYLTAFLQFEQGSIILTLIVLIF